MVIFYIKNVTACALAMDVRVRPYVKIVFLFLVHSLNANNVYGDCANNIDIIIASVLYVSSLSAFVVKHFMHFTSSHTKILSNASTYIVPTALNSKPLAVAIIFFSPLLDT